MEGGVAMREHRASLLLSSDWCHTGRLFSSCADTQPCPVWFSDCGIKEHMCERFLADGKNDHNLFILVT